MHILNEYIAYHKQYAYLYGSNTIIMMEVGSFFELYAVPNDKEPTGYLGANIYLVCDLLNIQVTKRNKAIQEVNEDNYLMAGFPNHSVKKFIDILVENKYVVVLVEQVTPPPKVTRKQTQIYSPSTHVENIKSYHANNMMTLYVEKVPCKTQDYMFMIGWSVFDPSTGISYTNESTSEKDYKVLLDDIYRTILKYDPKELVLLSLPNMVESKELYDYLNDGRYCLNKLNDMDPMYAKLNFQNSILKKVYKDIGILSPIEYIHLEFKPFALISYVYLLQFAFEHNEHFVWNMSKPIIEENKKEEMVLAYNAVNQLNMIGGTVSIESIFNNCITSIGKRFFKDRILTPITNEHELKSRYMKTRMMMKHQAWEYNKHLTTVKDIERLVRKGATGNLQPTQYICLHESLLKLNDVFESLNRIEDIKTHFMDKYSPDVFQKYKDHCDSIVDMDEMSKYNLDSIKTNIFKKGCYVELDEYYDALKIDIDFFRSKLPLVEDNWLKLEFNERDGYFFMMTSKRWTSLTQQKHPITKDLQTNGSVSNQVKLTNPTLKDKNNKIREIEHKARQLSIEKYKTFIEQLIQSFQESLFQPFIHLLEEIDFHICCAKNSKTYNLTEPTIESNGYEQSYFSVDEVRHPLVEYLQKDLQYTSNSIDLGEKEKGLILFGVNAAGKSSFMKSIGVNLIMAQAGMNVSCKNLRFKPYHQLFTRILSSDNIIKGMSTFACEIYEIRNILEKIDQHSIVIGDELCSGTESVSAISIIMAGIECLVQANSTFIFATHLHELTKLQRIQTMKDDQVLMIKHLKVVYDEEADVLIYDRKLADGPGSALYGLEVCKAMDMKPNFIHTASMIRREIMNESNQITDNVTSRYNRKVIIDRCGLCNKSQQVETHHIRFQQESNQHGMIDQAFHKNAQFNLLPLCEDCHDKVHQNKIMIEGWKQTSKGKVLYHHHTNKDPQVLYDVDTILHVRKSNTLKGTVKCLQEEYNITISEYKLKQILKEYT